jgi:uncharacterized membrane protein YheB (UPF0754 family)
MEFGRKSYNEHMAKKLIISEERKLRNITDYILDCTSRLRQHAELLAYLGKHKEDFCEGEGEKRRSFPIIISMFDVYSRDAIVVLGNILDQDLSTSSLFTLVSHLKDAKKQKRYLNKLKKLKSDLNVLVRARHNHIAHFNTDLNIHEKGHMQINVPTQFSPIYMKKILKKIESFTYDIKEELSIDGVFMMWGGSITDSFAELIGKRKRKSPQR